MTRKKITGMGMSKSAVFRLMGEINERVAFLPIEGWRSWGLEAILCRGSQNQPVLLSSGSPAAHYRTPGPGADLNREECLAGTQSSLCLGPKAIGARRNFTSNRPLRAAH